MLTEETRPEGLSGDPTTECTDPRTECTEASRNVGRVFRPRKKEKHTGNSRHFGE